MRKSGFTMAEVLITLGILAVVIAMTMPSLIMKYQEKEMVTRLKKVYSTLSNAYNEILYEHGKPDEWGISSYDEVSLLFTKYIKKAKVCSRNSPQAKRCFNVSKRYDLLKLTSGNTYNGASSFIMNDGMIAGFDAQVGVETALKCTELNYCFHIVVDLNGNKPPNQWGVDTFLFHVTKDKIVPRGALNTHGRQHTCDPTKSTASGWVNGSGCGAWVLQMENMDYMKCVRGDQSYCDKKYYF